ncbi:Os07g0472700 [Oryza sativa Japonica Group]|uniref:Os07g0472700 protein n=1 Tax=Oryza sativa subsp. japonica TaxID=39947 RepID=A0A0P0X6A1_ORYSJ|nr:Os07g0472700 [Oryza sativa Japonica Group]
MTVEQLPIEQLPSEQKLGVKENGRIEEAKGSGQRKQCWPLVDVGLHDNVMQPDDEYGMVDRRVAAQMIGFDGRDGGSNSDAWPGDGANGGESSDGRAVS